MVFLWTFGADYKLNLIIIIIIIIIISTFRGVGDALASAKLGWVGGAFLRPEPDRRNRGGCLTLRYPLPRSTKVTGCSGWGWWGWVGRIAFCCLSHSTQGQWPDVCVGRSRARCGKDEQTDRQTDRQTERLTD